MPSCQALAAFTLSGSKWKKRRNLLPFEAGKARTTRCLVAGGGTSAESRIGRQTMSILGRTLETRGTRSVKSRRLAPTVHGQRSRCRETVTVQVANTTQRPPCTPPKLVTWKRGRKQATQRRCLKPGFCPRDPPLAPRRPRARRAGGSSSSAAEALAEFAVEGASGCACRDGAIRSCHDHEDSM